MSFGRRANIFTVHAWLNSMINNQEQRSPSIVLLDDVPWSSWSSTAGVVGLDATATSRGSHHPLGGLQSSSSFGSKLDADLASESWGKTIATEGDFSLESRVQSMFHQTCFGSGPASLNSTAAALALAGTARSSNPSRMSQSTTPPNASPGLSLVTSAGDCGAASRAPVTSFASTPEDRSTPLLQVQDPSCKLTTNPALAALLVDKQMSSASNAPPDQGSAKYMHQPQLPYPLWDSNWDGLENLLDLYGMTSGCKRRLLLIRHGHYDTTGKEDMTRVLTARGRLQAAVTGKRLAKLLKARPGVPISVIRSSGQARAKETAAVIQKHIPHVPLAEPDRLLNEAIPAVPLPPYSDFPDARPNSKRVAKAFRKYFYRRRVAADEPDELGYEVIVGHGNLIRYFFCRAMQFPPEGWSRLSVAHCSITEINISPNGSCSCLALGDCGHLTGKGGVTFS